MLDNPQVGAIILIGITTVLHGITLWIQHRRIRNLEDRRLGDSRHRRKRD